MIRKLKHIFIIALTMLMGGAALAQNDPLFVIKKDGHYLAHVGSGNSCTLQNVDEFSPNCLWYSGNTVDIYGVNHNYYFIDGSNLRFLSAPLEAGANLGLSASFPGEQILRNVEQIYYFYNWDMLTPGEAGGVARGIQHTQANTLALCNECGGSWSDPSHPTNGECWTVYWVEYYAGTNEWKLSGTTSYNITANSGRFRGVSVNESVTPVEGTGLLSLNEGGSPTTGFGMDYSASPLSSASLSTTISSPYRYTAYTSYTFEGGTHNYYNVEVGGASTDHGTSVPSAPNGNTTAASYQWTISGPGAQYFSFSNEAGSNVTTSTNASPTLYYSTPNNTGHKTATLTFTVTYNDGATQTLTATVTAKTPCQNPLQAGAPVVTYDNVTVSWIHTAEQYKIGLKKNGGAWRDTIEVNNVSSYRFTGLEYNTEYEYRVTAKCNGSYLDFGDAHDFKTKTEPELMIYGSIFGGGRIANVNGKTEVVVINCDSIGAVYGGNDIAGTVRDSSIVILGINASAASDSYAHLYNGNAASTKVRVNDVYGGGNGYYAYNGTSFVAASSSYSSQSVAAGGQVRAMTQSNQVGEVVWENEDSSPVTLSFPSISKTSITVTNDQVKVDSLFGGAKNAFLTFDDWHYNGDSIVIDGGTILSVFGGNNIGGSQGKGKHYIKVTGTTTNLNDSIENTSTTGYGRDFGIRYLFGGGNKVYGSTTDVRIEGGQLDTIFAGGNSADVYAANITVNCSLASGSGATFGNTYSEAIASYSGTITVNNDYEWDGYSGIYNVRTLFGGNNEASMESVPNITLTSGSIGTAYGGGNAGDMLAHRDGSVTLETDAAISMKYSTHVVMNSPTILVDYLYGGCQISSVDYSTWVEIQNGHVGTVYGGCNVSGDVGSTRVYPDAPGPKSLLYQAVQGSTYVKATGGIVYKNLFAGGNGFYHCNDGVYYITSTFDYADEEGRYIGLPIPTHNETHVIVGTGATVQGNVYAGGNLAPVGYTDATNVGKPYPAFVGLASVRMEGGTVEGDVYGGGNMASIQGSNEVRVLGGTIGGALYGGNDRLGAMAIISNRLLPSEYDVASDEHTSLLDLGTRTYVGVSGRPNINTVYGGGNGAYDYSGTSNGGDMDYCNPGDQPIQSYTFVDIHIDGSADGLTPAGHINTVYGGGNGVTVNGSIVVFINVQNPNSDEHIGTIFGGNNMGDLSLIPDIILLHGNVDTVYGGCNQGAMIGRQNITIGGTTYNNVGSMVRLRDEYVATNTAANPTTHTTTPTAKVLSAVYGGCRMNGVQYDDLHGNTTNTNSLVLVEGGNHSTATMFGGSDISGTISGTSQVVVTGGTIANAIGGGNGDYYYKEASNAYGSYFEVYTDNTETVLVADSVSGRPYSTNSRVDMLGGTATNLYAGGNACNSGATVMQMENGTVSTGIYGGCNSSGNIVGDVVVNINGGTLGTNETHMTSGIFGGGYGQNTTTTGDVEVNIGDVAGTKTPTIYADIYGGSALGSVNHAVTGSEAPDTTFVNFNNGTIHGNVYGGGLGAATLNGNGYINTSEPTIAAIVNGTVQVNIGDPSQSSGNSVTIDGSVFGGNNLAGSPQGDIYVDIYKTAHTTTPTNNTYPSPVPDPWTNAFSNSSSRYALSEVYGGGNLAHYVPTIANSSTNVHVHNCDNTIQYVYGGGNAANVSVSKVIIDGGLVQYVFGGGNGYGTGNPGANVVGNDTIALNGGLVQYVFGGSNANGMVQGETCLEFAETPTCSSRLIDELYGGGNQAADANGITLNVPCGTSGVDVIYGGARMADVGTSETPANVVLNVNGGQLDAIYGGNNISGTIYGNVTLNLHGGTIDKAFGGNNAGGDILGTIQVNVLDTCTACPLDVNTVYGGGNMAAYTPTSTATPSPQVNVIHGTVNDAVYGGGMGNGAAVTANPIVTIGDNVAAHKAIVGATLIDGSGQGTGNVYGGGDAAAVNGSTTVIYQDTHDDSQVNRLFGGGNQANTNGTTINMNDGKVLTGIYGGCNTNGTVVDDIEVNVNGGTLGVEGTPMTSGIFGGGYGNLTQTNGNVTVNIGDATHTPTIYSDVYGGSALGNVHTPNTSTDHTTVNFAKGTLNGNLYGGGLGQASPAIAAEVNGNVIMNIGKDKNGTTVTGGTIVGSVFGANNIQGEPEGTVTVNVYSATVTNVCGGGNQADYTAPLVSPGVYSNYPEVNISGGEIINKVVGGGNAANITGNPHINISGGNVCTGLTGSGIYGGCNASGTVNGSVTVNITSADGNTVIGTQAALGNETPTNVHGGGYGSSTGITGDVTVNFGTVVFDDVSGDEIHTEYPKLYGDLYGGSALGSVNGTTASSSRSTTVNVLNGSFGYVEHVIGGYPVQFGGNIYGGGLGDAVGNHPAKVYGVVHVNVGADAVLPATTPTGQADLTHCNVYGCNNAFGSPQEDVYVDVYQTAHLSPYNVYTYTQVTPSAPAEDYAIANVFGGGNKANYAPDDNTKRPYTNVHYCENTIEYVYGGGNTADANGTNITVDGGRFKFIFGGGNGQISAANVGAGGVYMTILSGRVGWAFGGCNMHGEVYGGDANIHGVYGCVTGDCPCGDDPPVIENYYFGANMATVFGGLMGQSIDCGADFVFKKVYAGSRLATVYGNIELEVNGGSINNLFGGCEGSQYIHADVKKYPSSWEDINNFPVEDQAGLREHFENHSHDADYGQGGNITLYLYGGKIGNVYGGCDYRGNVEGVITIIIDSTQSNADCRLDIDYVFGGNNLAEYKPLDSLNIESPIIQIINGHVNGAVYGGSMGGDPSHHFGNGRMVSNPKVIIGDTTDPSNKVRIGGMLHSTPTPTQGEGDVYGGGNAGDVKGDTHVIIQGKVEIKNNVLGGGKNGDVNGNTYVTIHPTGSKGSEQR